MGARVPIVLLFSLSLAGCGSRADSPELSASVDPGRVATAGVENAAIREVVLDFLRAYADSGSDTQVLEQLVAGPHLEDWVYWLGVQNMGLEDRLTGEVELRGLRVLEIGQDVAAAAVDATVTLTVALEGGVETSRRNFGSPVLLVRPTDDPASWRVVDATRDGRSMQESITLFEEVPARVDQDGIQVEVASLYRFSTGTVANIRIRNTTKRALRVDGPRSLLQVGERFLASTAMTRTLRLPLRPGGSVEGALNFPPITIMNNPDLLMVRFQGDPAAATIVPFPPEGFAPTPS